MRTPPTLFRALRAAAPRAARPPFRNRDIATFLLTPNDLRTPPGQHRLHWSLPPLIKARHGGRRVNRAFTGHLLPPLGTSEVASDATVEDVGSLGPAQGREIRTERLLLGSRRLAMGERTRARDGWGRFARSARRIFADCDHVSRRPPFAARPPFPLRDAPQARRVGARCRGTS